MEQGRGQQQAPPISDTRTHSAGEGDRQTESLAAMETPAPPGERKHKGEGPAPPAPTSLADRELDDAVCPNCQDYLTDPVIIECGHNFCRGCINQHCEGVETAACPQCGEMFQKRAFRPNTQLGSIIQFIKQLGLKPGQRGREGNVFLGLSAAQPAADPMFATLLWDVVLHCPAV
uniref:RING-type domain-containing protein n=1 Tax=Chrysemys picta bellii TaxID=8478 RepID=A0A8C3FRX6_CHRPI